MTGQVILVFGGGAVWIRKPFEALADHARVIAVTPTDPIAWLRHRGNGMAASGSPGFTASSLPMPFGWASWLGVAQRFLWQRALAAHGLSDRDVGAVFVTTPHYLPMVRAIGDRAPVFYYAADSYRAYPGWNGTAMLNAEREIVRAACRSFFVSEALMARAIEESGVTPGKAAVSMNATGEEFLEDRSRESDPEVAKYLADLPRPVVVVIGAISQRLDFALLQKCADSARVGSLVFVGPQVDLGMDPESHSMLAALKGHAKCRFVGGRPHAQLPSWAAMSDIALVPYRESELNYFSSPMRLFDHLASGRPIVTTAACHQFRRFESVVSIGDSHGEVVERLAAVADRAPDGSKARELVRDGHLWRHRAAAMRASMAQASS